MSLDFLRSSVQQASEMAQPAVAQQMAAAALQELHCKALFCGALASQRGSKCVERLLKLAPASSAARLLASEVTADILYELAFDPYAAHVLEKIFLYVAAPGDTNDAVRFAVPDVRSKHGVVAAARNLIDISRTWSDHVVGELLVHRSGTFVLRACLRALFSLAACAESEEVPADASGLAVAEAVEDVRRSAAQSLGELLGTFHRLLDAARLPPGQRRSSPDLRWLLDGDDRKVILPPSVSATLQAALGTADSTLLPGAAEALSAEENGLAAAASALQTLVVNTWGAAACALNRPAAALFEAALISRAAAGAGATQASTEEGESVAVTPLDHDLLSRAEGPHVASSLLKHSEAAAAGAFVASLMDDADVLQRLLGAASQDGQPAIPHGARVVVAALERLVEIFDQSPEAPTTQALISRTMAALGQWAGEKSPGMAATLLLTDVSAQWDSADLASQSGSRRLCSAEAIKSGGKLNGDDETNFCLSRVPCVTVDSVDENATAQTGERAALNVVQFTKRVTPAGALMMCALLRLPQSAACDDLAAALVARPLLARKLSVSATTSRVVESALRVESSRALSDEQRAALASAVLAAGEADLLGLARLRSTAGRKDGQTSASEADAAVASTSSLPHVRGRTPPLSLLDLATHTARGSWIVASAHLAAPEQVALAATATLAKHDVELRALNFRCYRMISLDQFKQLGAAGYAKQVLRKRQQRQALLREALEGAAAGVAASSQLRSARRVVVSRSEWHGGVASGDAGTEAKEHKGNAKADSKATKEQGPKDECVEEMARLLSKSGGGPGKSEARQAKRERK